MSDESGPKPKRKPRKKANKSRTKRSEGKKPSPLTAVQRDERKRALVEHLAETGDTITGACKAIGLARSAFWRWRQDDPQWSAEIDMALREGVDVLVQEAKRRAFEGWEEPVHYQGVATSTIRKYDSTLLMFLIKQRDPSFRDPKFSPPVITPPRGDSVAEVDLDDPDMPNALRFMLKEYAQRKEAKKLAR